jgi:carboxymethylenebutenolidase
VQRQGRHAGLLHGGRLAYHVAAQTDVDAAVCYYGGGIHTVLGEAHKIRAPILFHFAEKDGFIPPDAVDAVRQTFGDRANAMVELYKGVDHGFNCWGRPMYDQRAAALARGRSLAFLATNMPD